MVFGMNHHSATSQNWKERKLSSNSSFWKNLKSKKLQFQTFFEVFGIKETINPIKP